MQLNLKKILFIFLINLFYTKNSYQDPAEIYQGIIFAAGGIYYLTATLYNIFKISIIPVSLIMLRRYKKNNILNTFKNNFDKELLYKIDYRINTLSTEELIISRNKLIDLKIKTLIEFENKDNNLKSYYLTDSGKNRTSIEVKKIYQTLNNIIDESINKIQQKIDEKNN